MFSNIEIDNVFAVVIFIIAMAGIIGLTVYKMYKKNNGITLEAFLDEHYEHIISVLQDVVSILLVNVEDYPDKETYEKDIIRLTIEKLDENCEEFGIDTGMLKLINKDALAEGIHKILTAENVTVFTSTVPKEVMEENKELYDENVLEVAEVLDAVNKEIEVNNESVKEAEMNTVDQSVHDAIEHIMNDTEDVESFENVSIEENNISEEVNDEMISNENKLPPRETYYGKDDRHNSITMNMEDLESSEVEIVNPKFPVGVVTAKTEENTGNDVAIPANIIEDESKMVTTKEEVVTNVPFVSADVDSATSTIKNYLTREHIDHE